MLLSRFSNVFGLLYAAGVSVIDGLKISRGALGNKFVARGMDTIIENITNGSSISAAFRESGLFPPLVLRMIKLGETTGGVDAAMQQIKGITTAMPMKRLMLHRARFNRFYCFSWRVYWCG